ncbi:MAG: hemerythrin domain-containing protein [Rhodoferax sp.]|nr:hemerythrin domain-containing protein [Rhodoferax sp.]MCB2043620.1 hemerythrin domain-containing protein [Rhodoferax sp.]MCW5630453.1 hemerythrin domain-containing protein [Rhodoferax sp.]
MTANTSAVTNPVVEAPLTNFSNCHQGIIAHLDAFGELPAMLETAQRTCAIAEETLQFFRVAVFDHHAEEEKDLFPAVLAAAQAGAERDKVQGLVDALVAEHREIEALWRGLEPGLAKLAKGQLATGVDRQAVVSLVQRYHAHARLEEERFLPLAETILGRQGPKMAELGLALHMRQVVKAARRGLRGS